MKYLKLLGIKIDRELSFQPHVESLCKRASQGLSVLFLLFFYQNDIDIFTNNICNIKTIKNGIYKT